MSMEHPIFSWESSLFLWPFSIAMFVYQRVAIVKKGASPCEGGSLGWSGAASSSTGSWLLGYPATQVEGKVEIAQLRSPKSGDSTSISCTASK